jgi:predicted amidohydrolase YtcJ
MAAALILAMTACTGGAGTGGASPTASAGVADLIIYGGPILTMDPVHPRAEAIAIAHDWIVAVGSREEIVRLASPSATVIDLGGATLMPGFVDAHSHFFGRADKAGTDPAGVSEYILSQGITTTAELYVDESLLAELQRLNSSRRLSVRVSAYLAANDACGQSLGDWWREYAPTRQPAQMLRIGGVKVYTDGGACNTPAASFEYLNGLGHGDLYFTAAQLTELLRSIDATGHQAAMHALGDRAVQTVLDAMEQVIGTSGNPRRHRIEHAAATRPDLRARPGQIGAVVTIFGPYQTCFLTGKTGAFNFRTPAEYLEWEWPWRILLDASPGAHFAWHADFPVFQDGDPIHSLYGFVTRAQIAPDGSVCEPTPAMASGAISVDEALSLMTTGSAYALFRENELGRVAPGLLADFVILSGDPTGVQPAALKDLQVWMTMVGGQVAWCRSGREVICPR